jgi:carboxymethylenebutenolidase
VGFNDQVKVMAAELAEFGYIAYAIDLYEGQVADKAKGAKALVSGVGGTRVIAQLIAAVEHLRTMDGSTGKVGAIGWCFGGGLSLNASTATTVDATVICYGRVNVGAYKLAKFFGPVLGHFGALDKNINKKTVCMFKVEMGEAGKSNALSVNWYEADHTFANPTGARYDADDAALAWTRTRVLLVKT